MQEYRSSQRCRPCMSPRTKQSGGRVVTLAGPAIADWPFHLAPVPCHASRRFWYEPTMRDTKGRHAISNTCYQRELIASFGYASTWDSQACRKGSSLRRITAVRHALYLCSSDARSRVSIEYRPDRKKLPDGKRCIDSGHVNSCLCTQYSVYWGDASWISARAPATLTIYHIHKMTASGR